MSRELKDAVQQLAGTFNRDIVEIISCNVDSVNEDTMTCDCTPITGNAITDIPDVQLTSEVADGILLIPKIGSTVIVAKSTRNTAFVLMYSDIDNIILRGGQLGGLIKIADLVSKINRLENLLNGFITIYNTHTHAVSGAATLVPNQTETGSITPITSRNDIENTKITHG